MTGERNHRPSSSTAGSSTVGACARKIDVGGDGDRGCDPHGFHGGDEARRDALSSPDGGPFQKRLRVIGHAPERAQDGVQAEVRFVGKTRQAEARLREAAAGGARYGGQVLAPQNVLGAAEGFE